MISSSRLLSRLPGVVDTRRRWQGERLYRNGRDGKGGIEALSGC